MENEGKRYYLSEFLYYDTDRFIVFNIVDINTDKKEISVAITDEGKISVRTFDLKSDGERFYFQYGVMLKEIAVDDFEQVDEQEF